MLRYIIRKKITIIFLLINVMLFSSCITSRKTNYLQEPSVFIPSYDDKTGYEEYKLTPSDKLYIRMYSTEKETNQHFNGNNQSMTTMMSGGGSSDYTDLYTFTVKNDGTIKVPIVEEHIYVAGKNIRETKKIIEEALKPYILEKFVVDVKIIGRYFSVIGGGSTGKFPIVREKMNIFQALALAGDLNTYSDRSKIKILRETNGTTQIKVFDIRSKDIINSEFYYIQPNDVIYIQNVNEQFFSVSTFGAALSTIFSTFSFGLFFYNLFSPTTPASN